MLACYYGKTDILLKIQQSVLYWLNSHVDILKHLTNSKLSFAAMGIFQNRI